MDTTPLSEADDCQLSKVTSLSTLAASYFLNWTWLLTDQPLLSEAAVAADLFNSEVLS